MHAHKILNLNKQGQLFVVTGCQQCFVSNYGVCITQQSEKCIKCGGKVQLGVSQTWFAQTPNKQKVAGLVWRDIQIPFGIVSGRASVVKKLIN